MAEVRQRRPSPGGQLDQREADIGFIFDDITRRVVAIYGDNPTEDAFRFELDAQGRTFSFVLLPGQTRRVPIPARFQLVETTLEYLDRRTGLTKTRTFIPFERIVTERVFARPRRASPVVLSVTQTIFGTASTTHNAAMPATVNAGDLLTNVFGFYSDGSAATSGTPSGWSKEGQVTDANFTNLSYYGKNATGSEDGTNVNFTTTIACDGVAHIYRIEAGSWDDSGTVLAALAMSAAATGSSATANPPSLTSGFGSVDALWLYAIVASEDTTAIATPATYTEGGEGASADLRMSSGYRTNTAASEDPGTAALTGGTDFWLAATFAVKPSSAPAPITGTMAGAEGADVMSASGTVTPPISTGSLAATEGSDVMDASGTAAPPTSTGSLQAIEQPDVMDASGDVTNPVAGDLDGLEAPDVMDASGTFTPLPVSGVFAGVEPGDVMDASGLSAPAVVFGTIAGLEGPDVMVGTGLVPTLGILVATDGADVMVMVGITYRIPAAPGGDVGGARGPSQVGGRPSVSILAGTSSEATVAGADEGVPSVREAPPTGG